MYMSTASAAQAEWPLETLSIVLWMSTKRVLKPCSFRAIRARRYEPPTPDSSIATFSPSTSGRKVCGNRPMQSQYTGSSKEPSRKPSHSANARDPVGGSSTSISASTSR